MITVNAKLFGPLRDIFHRDELLLQVPPPHNGEAAFNALVTIQPDVERWKSSVRLAVNLEYSSFETELKDGDEIGLIPPVSGG